MKYAEAYKDIQPTYNELVKALENLSFENRSKKDVFSYFHQDSGAHVLLPQEIGDVMVNKARFIALSYNLMGMGVLKHEFDLGKMIEQHRLQAQSATA